MARPGAIVGTLSLIVFLRVMGITLVVTGFLSYVRTLGGTPLQGGLALGAYPLALAIFLTPMGHLSDRYGRRRVMLAGLLVAAAGSLVAAFAPNWWLLALGRFISGAGAINGVALAIAGETSTPDTRTRRFAVLGAAAGGGVVLGLVGGQLLVSAIGMRGLLLGFALANLAILPLLRNLPDAPVSPTGRLRVERVVLLLGTAAFSVNFSLTLLLALLETLVHAAAPGTDISLLLLGMLLPAGLGMFAASRLADRGHVRSVGIAAAAMLGVAPLVFATGRASIWWLLAAGIVFFLGQSSLTSLLPSLLSHQAREGGRGAAQGVQSTLQYLGSFAGSVAAGALAATALGLSVAFVAAGVLVALVIIRVVRHRPVVPALPVPAKF
ncbi:MAG: MFS transporter [Candidatus Thermoplasmatota archaeon]